MVDLGKAHLRHLFSMSTTEKQQAYFSQNQSAWWPGIKKHILLAPLWKKRHNREIRLSSAVNIGTLPSRFHAILLCLYLLSNFIYCALLDYRSQNHYKILAELRGRSGALAVANMIVLVLLAGRNNPLISILKISFDTFNLLHRWIGRIVVLEAIIHAMAWTITQVASDGWASVNFKIGNDSFIRYGMGGLVALVLILVTSPSAIRHAFYETFLNAHIIFAATAIASIWIHCDIEDLPQLPHVKSAVGLWVGDRMARLARLLWHYMRHYLSRLGDLPPTIDLQPCITHNPRVASIICSPPSHSLTVYAARMTSLLCHIHVGC
jgi:hypothetical protein